MKVNIEDRNGTLVISADNHLEAFALQKWYDMWKQRTVTFLIQGVDNTDGLLHHPYNIVEHNESI